VLEPFGAAAATVVAVRNVNTALIVSFILRLGEGTRRSSAAEVGAILSVSRFYAIILFCIKMRAVALSNLPNRGKVVPERGCGRLNDKSSGSVSLCIASSHRRVSPVPQRGGIA
jgi:hypothetical protein